MRKIEEIKMKRMQKDKKPVVKPVKSVKNVECFVKQDALSVDKKCDTVETEPELHADFVVMSESESDITVNTSNVPVMETTLNFESPTPAETADTPKPKKHGKKKKVVDEPNDWNSDWNVEMI